MNSSDKKEIVSKYVDCLWSIQDISIWKNISRNKIKKILEESEIEIRKSPSERSIEKAKKTSIERYGVDNYNKLPEVRKKNSEDQKNNYSEWQKNSQIIRWILSKGIHPNEQERFETYKSHCLWLTEKNKKKLRWEEKCYYTNITFEEDYKNPYGRAVDHKISILDGWNRKISPEKISSVDNLCWCCNIVNNLKKELSEKEFKESGIIQRFLQARKQNLI